MDITQIGRFLINVCLLSFTIPFILAVLAILCGGIAKLLDSKRNLEESDRINEVVFTLFFFIAVIGYLSYLLFNK
jgi:nitrogen fixation/metabolism regulation signal transduction histidine kinase